MLNVILTKAILIETNMIDLNYVSHTRHENYVHLKNKIVPFKDIYPDKELIMK